MFRIFIQIVLINFVIISNAFSFNPFFDSIISYPMGTYIETMAYTDLNNDGNVDIICGAGYNADATFAYLNVYMNDGDGTYQTPVRVDNGFSTSVIIASDFNNDGWNDLLTFTNYSDLNIIMNQGDGALVLEHTYSGTFTEYLTVLDMNNDGFMDIVNVNGINIEISFNNGDGTFNVDDKLVIQTDIAGKPVPWKVNNDDYTDLLIYGYKVSTTDSINYTYLPVISTFQNDSGSSFIPKAEYLHGTSTQDVILGFETGYLNADSEKDILITDFQNNRIVLTNNGDGSFNESYSMTLDYKVSMTLGDINNDNFSDIIISDSYNGNVSIMLNKGTDELAFDAKIDFAGKYGANPTFNIKIFSFDINNDQYDDIIQTQWYLSTITNRGDGTFPIYEEINNMGSGKSDMISGDFDNDAFTDILTLDENYVFVTFNNGKGVYTSPQKLNTNLDRNTGLFTGYFNDDEFLDFGVTSYGGLKLFYGQSDRTFESGYNLKDSVGFLAGYGGLSGDFNNDGFIDLATFYSGSYDLNILLNNNNGGYNLASYSLPDVPNTIHQDIATADLDNDNDLDIVIGSANKAIYINYNEGDGTFPTYTTLSTDEIVQGVTLADLNDDGYIDIAATQAFGTGSVLVYLNNGDGTFTSADEYCEYFDFRYDKITSVDMDNDGDLDLVTSLEVGGEIAILFNDGDGTFPYVQYYSCGDAVLHFTVADFDKDVDSTRDIAVMNGLASRNSILMFSNLGGTTTDIKSENKKEIIPNKIVLSQNYPNPFNPSTTIQYTIPLVERKSSFAQSSNKSQSGDWLYNVTLKVYDVLGREVAILINKQQAPGNYSVEFNASKLSSGIYFYRLQAGQFSDIKKMILLK